MSISAEQLRDILHHINTHDMAAAEVRRAPRVKIQLPVELTPCGRPDAERIASRIVDISARGAKLLHPRPLEPGEQVLLHIPEQHRGEVSILCNVCNCHETSARKYNVGIEFIGPAAVPNPNSIEEETRRIRASILT